MLFTRMTFVGIDVTAGRKPCVFAALDNERKLLALSQGSLEDVLAFLAGQEAAFAAVNAPRRPNQGLLAKEEIRQNLEPQPRPGRWMQYRLCEFELRQRNIALIPTPGEEDCSAWMQAGFRLFRQMESFGYLPYPAGEQAALQSLEVNAHAGYSALLGMTPFDKHSLEGRLQRQLVLYEKEIEVTDPLRFFEEVTRYKLLHGILPLDDIYSPVELDAMAAAYTAWLAANHPDQVTLVGDPTEGQIVLPSGELKAKY